MASRTIFLILAAVFLGSAAGSAVFLNVEAGDGQKHAAFKAFRLKHHREYKYGTAEYDMRKALFEQRSAAVHAHNAKEGPLWKAALNHFSDRTIAERKSVLGYVRGASSGERGIRGGLGGSLLQVGNLSAELPESKDWMHLKSASHVRDQGECGSCWAVTTTSMLEAHHEIYMAKGGKVRSFSAQQTLECTPNPEECGGQGGCQGATVELGMAYILKNGIATDDEVPYRGKDAKCQVNGLWANKKVSLKPVDLGMTYPDDPFAVLAATSPAENAGGAFGLVGYHTLERNADYPLAEAVAKYGPVAITVGANENWMSYSKGIFHGCEKDVVLNHAVTLYGYGTDSQSKTKYWTIRNSWGAEFGENGFIRIQRTQGCGTDDNNQEGTGCKGDVKSVKVCGMCGMLYDSVVPYFRGSPGHSDSAAQVSIDGSALMRMKAEPHRSD